MKRLKDFTLEEIVALNGNEIMELESDVVRTRDEYAIYMGTHKEMQEYQDRNDKWKALGWVHDWVPCNIETYATFLAWNLGYKVPGQYGKDDYNVREFEETNASKARHQVISYSNNIKTDFDLILSSLNEKETKETLEYQVTLLKQVLALSMQYEEELEELHQEYHTVVPNLFKDKQYIYNDMYSEYQSALDGAQKSLRNFNARERNRLKKEQKQSLLDQKKEIEQQLAKI